MKNTQYEINNEIKKANGIFECYNVTENMIHLARVGVDGKKLKPSQKNLLNLTVSSFHKGVLMGQVVAL